jgi:hypothetical protein
MFSATTFRETSYVADHLSKYEEKLYMDMDFEGEDLGSSSSKLISPGESIALPRDFLQYVLSFWEIN